MRAYLEADSVEESMRISWTYRRSFVWYLVTSTVMYYVERIRIHRNNIEELYYQILLIRFCSRGCIVHCINLFLLSSVSSPLLFFVPYHTRRPARDTTCQLQKIGDFFNVTTVPIIAKLWTRDFEPRRMEGCTCLIDDEGISTNRHGSS